MGSLPVILMRTIAMAVSLILLPLLDAQGWVDRSTANCPSPRYHHALCYDAAHGYTLLFGGGYPASVPTGFARSNETWVWNGASWLQRTTATTPMQSLNTPYRNVAMSYHTAMSQVVLVSGDHSFIWNGADWIQQPPAGWWSDVVPCMEYDSVHAETVLFDANPPYPAPNLVYIWNGSTWSTRQQLVSPPRFSVSGYPPHSAVDPVTHRMVLAGMHTTSGSAFWEWTGLLWQQRYPQIPNPPIGTPFFGAMAGDTLHGRIVMVDTLTNNYPQQPNHTWTISNGTINRLTTPVEPGWRQESAMCFDAGRGVCVLFGGNNDFPMGDTWEFDLGFGPAWSTYGGGCPGTHGVPAIAAQGSSLPRVAQTFNVQVNNLPFTGPVFLFLGLSDQSYFGNPLPFSLGALGAPNCSLLCSGDQLQVLTNVLGSAVWSFTVPPFPGATFFNQAIALDPTANALGLTTSNGGRGIIGM